MTSADLARLQSEQTFFDAEMYTDCPLSPQTVGRYRYCRHRYRREEAAYVALGHLRG